MSLIQVQNNTKDRFEDSDDFIQRYIIECHINDFEFNTQGPYIFDGETCLDISDNNGMQWFVIIENDTLENITEKVVKYFYKEPINEYIQPVIPDNLKLQKLLKYFEQFDGIEQFYVGEIKDEIIKAINEN